LGKGEKQKVPLCEREDGKSPFEKGGFRGI
jgi:hypothetical protein